MELNSIYHVHALDEQGNPIHDKDGYPLWEEEYANVTYKLPITYVDWQSGKEIQDTLTLHYDEKLSSTDLTIIDGSSLS